MHTIKIKNQNILLLSDTHGKHRLIDIPKNIQIIIHCGDICNAGDMDKVLDFFKWYAQLEIPHKIFIQGNHHLPFELEPEWGKRLIPKDIIWLNDEAIVIREINIMESVICFFVMVLKLKIKLTSFRHITLLTIF